MAVILHGLIGQNVQRLAAVGSRNELELVQIPRLRTEEVIAQISEVREKVKNAKLRLVQV